MESGRPRKRTFRRWFVAPFFVALTGIAATLIGWQVAEQRQDAAVEEHVTRASQDVASELGDALGRAISGADSFAGLSQGRRLPAPDDYSRLWEEYGDVLVGESTVQLVVQIPTRGLEAVAVAERANNPAFVFRLLRDPPPPDGHLVILRSPDGPRDVGIDLSTLTSVSERLRSIGVGEQAFFSGDTLADAEDFSTRLMAIKNRTGLDHDGRERPTWTVVQIDLDAAASASFDRLPDGYGGQVRLRLGPRSHLNGTSRDTALAQTSVAAAVGDVEYIVDLWADARATSTIAPQAVLGFGLLATVAAVFATLLVQFVRSLFGRLERSDRAARVDALTGLANRRWLFEHLADLAERPIGVLFCDLDRFKEVNDRFGHGAGDDILIEVARRLTAAADEYVHIARFGGDEFVAVLALGADANDDDAVQALGLVAEQFIDAIADPFHTERGSTELNLSVGSSWRGLPGPTGEELIGRADRAMVLAKEAGGGHVVYDQALRDSELERIRIEGELAEALDNANFIVHYQPIVDVEGTVRSYEALVRWSRDGKLVPPGRFLPIVESLGRMADLGWIVLRQAVRDFALAVNRVPGDARTLHVNVEPMQLLDPEFASDVVALLDSHALAPERLVIELTEGEWMGANDAVLDAVDEIVGTGVMIAVDDFGSAYSSLSRVLELRDIAELKLDRSVVVNVRRRENAIFLAGLAETSRRLGIAMVAEGVETAEDFGALVEAGIVRFQGFFFSPPGPANEILLRPSRLPGQAASR